LNGEGDSIPVHFHLLDSLKAEAQSRTYQEQIMRESVDHLAMLRRELALIGGGERLSDAARFATGHEALDAALGGGLARGRVHELFAAEGDDSASAMGFAAMLALSVAKDAPILWLKADEAERRGGQLHGPGLAELGGDPDALVLGLAPDTKALLRGAADAARCAGLGALVVECWGKCPELNLTASRRLALAAEQSGVTLLMIRLEAEPSPSACDTRWGVCAAPSEALEANAPGLPMFEIELLRRRAGPAGMRWRLEWDRDQLAFREPALPGAVVPLPSRRPAAAELRLSA
jgi:protein ImuA